MKLRNLLQVGTGSILILFGVATNVVASPGDGQKPAPPPCYAPEGLSRFKPVVTSLEAAGIRVLEICRSHFEGTFGSSNSVALVMTDIGKFEIIVFESEVVTKNLRVTYSATVKNGGIWYTASVSGIENQSPFEAQGTQRLLFLTYRNWLVITINSSIERRVGHAFAALESRRLGTAPN